MAIDISNEINSIRSEPDGEDVSSAIDNAVHKLSLFAYQIDISQPSSIFNTTTQGKYMRRALSRELHLLSQYDEAPVIPISLSDYEESHESGKLYGIYDEEALTFTPNRRLFQAEQSPFGLADQLCYSFYSTNPLSSVNYFYSVAKNNPNINEVLWTMYFGEELLYIENESHVMPRRWYDVIDENSIVIQNTVKLDFGSGIYRLRKDYMESFRSLREIVIANSPSGGILKDTFLPCKQLKRVRIKMAPGDLIGYEYYPWGAPKDCEFIWGA